MVSLLTFCLGIDRLGDFLRGGLERGDAVAWRGTKCRCQILEFLRMAALTRAGLVVIGISKSTNGLLHIGHQPRAAIGRIRP